MTKTHECPLCFGPLGTELEKAHIHCALYEEYIADQSPAGKLAGLAPLRDTNDGHERPADSARQTVCMGNMA